MSSSAQVAYSSSAKGDQFWTHPERPMVMGDILGRFPSLALLDPQPGELILDAGSGAGFMSRLYARAGARVIGVEINPDMLAAARTTNEKERLPICYVKGDIAEHPFGYEVYDKISCVAVIFHLTYTEVEKFISNAYCALLPGGRLVLSFSSNVLMTEGSRRDLGWVRHGPVLEWDGSSTKRTEYYKNATGQTFAAEVWGHDDVLLKDMCVCAGFKSISHFTRAVTAEALVQANVTGPAGYVAFEQLVCEK